MTLEKQKRARKTRTKSEKALAVDIYKYTDFRAYLRDRIPSLFYRGKPYNLESFAKQIGFSSHAALAMILSGKRDLRAPYLDKCLEILNLNLNERLYFETLLRAEGLTPQKRNALLKDVQFFASKWAPPKMREGLRLIDLFIAQQILCLFKDQFLEIEKVRSYFRYQISIEELEKVFSWMQQTGAVEVSEGRFRVTCETEKAFILKDEELNLLGKNYHIDSLELAARALYSDPLENREFQTWIMTLDSKRLQELKIRVKELVHQIFNEFGHDKKQDTIIEFHFHLFEVIQRLQESGKDYNA